MHAGKDAVPVYKRMGQAGPGQNTVFHVDLATKFHLRLWSFASVAYKRARGLALSQGKFLHDDFAVAGSRSRAYWSSHRHS